MNDINEIRNEILTEDAKMEKIADYIEQDLTVNTIDKVLDNGDTAIGKQIIFKETADATDNTSMINHSTFSVSKRLTNGTATAQITSNGSLFLEYQPDEGQLTHLHIRVDEGVPKVMMSDDMRAAFKAELGIN